MIGVDVETGRYTPTANASAERPHISRTMLMKTPISTSPQGSRCDMIPSMMNDISTGLGAENFDFTFSPLSRSVSWPLMPGSSRYLMRPWSSTRYFPGGTAPRGSRKRTTLYSPWSRSASGPLKCSRPSNSAAANLICG